MQPYAIIICLLCYFAALMAVSYYTGAKDNNEGFFLANRRSPWYLIAFGMIGSSMSGVTFISVPGWVKETGFSYFQVALGYIIGYWVIAWVLLPVYYRLQLTSIYTYLDMRFGKKGYKTGAVFFLISRILGASFRLYVAVDVLQLCIFNQLHLPFIFSAMVLICLIWLYTRRGGMKTIVWTDALQTLFLLAALAGSIILISHALPNNFPDSVKSVIQGQYSRVFNWDVNSKYYFFKQFLSGIFIAIAMTGLDQDMMQKNLTCKTLSESQKNIISFSIVQAVVVLFFLILGVLLYNFAEYKHIPLPAKSDDLYPILATGGYLGATVAFLFIMGLTAASFASSDSALTALTTSFCMDILNFAHRKREQQVKLRKWVHLNMAVVLALVIILYNLINNPVIINAVFTVAGYTYGPLLGLYGFGLLTKIKANDSWVPYICIASPLLCFIADLKSETWMHGYHFGFELLILNAFITFTGLLMSAFTESRKVSS